MPVHSITELRQDIRAAGHEAKDISLLPVLDLLRRYAIDARDDKLPAERYVYIRAPFNDFRDRMYAFAFVNRLEEELPPKRNLYHKAATLRLCAKIGFDYTRLVSPMHGTARKKHARVMRTAEQAALENVKEPRQKKQRTVSPSE